MSKNQERIDELVAEIKRLSLEDSAEDPTPEPPSETPEPQTYESPVFFQALRQQRAETLKEWLRRR